MFNTFWERPALLLIHAAVLVIILGGCLTTWTAERGEMLMLPQQPNLTVNGPDGQEWELPFALTLESFEVVNYPGTSTPKDYVSHVLVEGGHHDIAMNRILRHRGYRFYQKDYNTDGSSILGVSHDPWGIGFTYCGYLLMTVGLLWMLLDRKGRFRRLLRGAAMVAALLAPLALVAQPKTLPRETADHMSRMMVLYQGRICPLQTYAKDFCVELTGESTYHGLTPEQVLAGCLFYHNDWATAFPTLNSISPSLKLYPIADTNGVLDWYAQNDRLPTCISADEYLFVRKSLGYCQELVLKGDFAMLDTVFDKTLKYQHKKVGNAMPSATRVAAERLYNRLTTGWWQTATSNPAGWTAKFALRWVAGGHMPLGGDNPKIANLMPVLNTPLLTVHVSLIILSYVLFLAVAGCSLAGLFTLRRNATTRKLQHASSVMLYPAVTLLALGIMLGAVWANISWGSYWTWDPKETCALVTLLVYALPLHGIKALSRPRVFHIYCLLALLSVALTWFGANLFGGLHAY